MKNDILAFASRPPYDWCSVMVDASTHPETEAILRELAMTLGEKLKDARKRARYSAEEAARALGLRSRDSIHRIERGSSEPSISQLQKLAELYGVSISDFLGTTTRTSDELQPILDALVDLDPATRMMLVRRAADAVRSVVLLMQWHAETERAKFDLSSPPPPPRQSRPSPAADVPFDARGGSRSVPPRKTSTPRPKGKQQSDDRDKRDRGRHRE